jgi:hypothetical protein
MTPTELETLVHRELKRLPPPWAPHTLAPRVLAAVRLRVRRPWYARPWMTWPRAWQAVSLGALIALVGTVATLWPAVAPPAVADLSMDLADLTRGFTAAASAVLSVASAVDVIRRALLQPVAGYLVVLVTVVCTAGVAFGAALTRVALGGARLP